MYDNYFKLDAKLYFRKNIIGLSFKKQPNYPKVNKILCNYCSSYDMT